MKIYKNYLLLFICLTLSNLIKSQQIIKCSIAAGGKITTDYNSKNNYSLPITFQFDPSFKGKAIEFWDSVKKQVVALKSAKFGDKNLNPDGETGNYLIKIAADGSISASNTDKINVESFTIKIANNFIGPFNIQTSKAIDGKSNSDTKQSYQKISAYYDALKLKDLYMSGTNIPLTIDILNSYHIYDSNDLSNNKFLNGIFDTKIFSQNAIQGGISPGIVSSIGGINITNFADGLAKFLVQRFKDELSQAFFEKFKDDLNNPKCADLKILFPQTWKTLQTIDNDIYQFSIYLNTLRQAFIKDLTNGFVDLQNLLQQQKYKDYFNNHPVLGTILNSSLYFINSLSAGKHPGQVLDSFNVNANIRLCKCGPTDDTSTNYRLQTNIRSAVKSIQLISYSFRSASTANYWVPIDSVKTLLEDQTSLKIYLGLLYQVSLSFEKDTNKIINFLISYNTTSKKYGSLKLTDVLNTLAQNIDSLYKYEDFIETFVNKTEEVNEYIAELKSKKKSEIDYNDYYKLYNACLDLLEQLSSFVDLPYIGLRDDLRAEIKSHAASLLYVARTAADLYVDVRTKNYSSAIQNTVFILDTLLNYNAIFKIKDLKNDTIIASKALLNDIKQNNISSNDSAKIFAIKNKYIANPNLDNNKIDYSDINTPIASGSQLDKEIIAFIVSQRVYNEVANHQTLRNSILKYGSFIAAVAEAQNSDDVEKAIESIALPVGSYTIKQHSKFNISVNGYVGYAFDFNGGMSSGIYAPVGISLNWGLGKNKKGGAATAFISVLDIGAIVAYRFKDTATQLKQDVRLESILSPSAQFIYELPKWPVALCVGWRLTPRLFYSNSQEFQVIKPKSVLNLSILIDIPLITIVNKTMQ